MRHYILSIAAFLALPASIVIANPAEYGTTKKLPSSYLGQLFYPFRPQK